MNFVNDNFNYGVSMIQNFKITLKQQMIILFPAFFVNVFLIVGSFYVMKFSITDFMIGYTFYFFIDMLPTIILHIQYWFKNHGAILNIDTDADNISYEKSNRQYQYSFSDIEALHYYRNLGKGSGWNSFGQYRYYKIIFHDRNEIVITCLMINNIENTLEGLLKMKAETHAKLLCLIE